MSKRLHWLHRVLCAARHQVLRSDAGRKLAIVRAATRYEFPSGDVATMLADIELGYTTGVPGVTRLPGPAPRS